MRFARLGATGEERPVVVADSRYLDLTPLTADIDGAFLENDPVERVREAIDAGAGTA